VGIDGETAVVGCIGDDRVGSSDGLDVGANVEMGDGESASSADGVGVPGTTVPAEGGTEAVRVGMIAVAVGVPVCMVVTTGVRVRAIVAVDRPEGGIVGVDAPGRASVTVAAGRPRGGSVRYGLSLPQR
jgi:hypothetical protein